MRFEDVDCLLCGAGRTRGIGKRRAPDRNPGLETTVVECLSCGLIYPNPMPRFTDSDIQNNFDNHEEYFPAQECLRFHEFKKAILEIENLHPEKGRLLDVGCGRGEFLHVAGEMVWKATGQDISRSFVEYGRRKLGVDAMSGELEDLGFPEESFDAVSLVSVIQCLQDPLKTLLVINRLLKKAGVLYIETTNEDALLFRIADFFKSVMSRERVTTHLSPLFPAYQLYGFNPRSLAKVLESAGFKICAFNICGTSGGGSVKGRGAWNFMLNLIRHVIIFFGGSMGMGHLIICLAKKEKSI